MAREDSRWFAAAVVILSLVLFLALPLAVLIVIDNMKLQAQMRQEIREVRKLKKELKGSNEKAIVDKPVSDGGM